MSDVVLIQARTGMDIASTCAPSHSLLCVAAPLDHEGYKVKIIDQRVNSNWKQDLLSELKTQPIFCGITAMTGTNIKFCIEVAKIIRENSKVPIVWGGPHPTLLYQQVLDSGLADYVVCGECDETIVQITRDIANHKAEKVIKNTLPDVENLLPTPWHLIDIEKYIHPDMYVKNGRRTSDLGQTSRGCPMNCLFCSSATIRGRKWRAMSPEKSIDMITSAVKKFNLTGFWLRDDEFYINSDRAAKISEGIIPLNVRWYTSGTRVDNFLRVPEDQVELYRRSGAYTLKFGAESGNNVILSLMNKGITQEQTLEANRKAMRHDITPAFALMCGFPTETFDQINDTIKLAKQLRKDNPKAQFETMAIYTAHPGTPMLSLAQAHGLILPTKLEEWATWNADEYDIEGKRIPWFNKSERIALGNLCYLSMLSNAMPNVLDALENVTVSKLLKMVYALPHEYFKWSFFNAHYKFHPELPMIRQARKFVFYSGHKVIK